MKANAPIPNKLPTNLDLWLAIRDLTGKVERQNGRIGRLENIVGWIAAAIVGGVIVAFLNAIL